jgi:translation initiation factor 6
MVVKTKNTALGNLIVANNKSCLVSTVLEEDVIKKIGEALGTKIFKKTFLGIPTIGSMIVVNDTRGLVHPMLADNEIEEIGRLLDIHAGPATVNEGVSFVKTGILLNNKGILVGQTTTGPEIMNIHSLLS